MAESRISDWVEDGNSAYKKTLYRRGGAMREEERKKGENDKRREREGKS